MIITRSLIIIICQRSVQALLGILTAFFIANYMSPIEQGWYYTFLSISSLYVVFELGVSLALIQASSQLFVNLRWSKYGNIIGKNLSDFISLIKASLKYYAKVSVIFFISITFCGFYYFSLYKNYEEIFWHTPWFLLIFLIGINLITIPILAIMEGSGQISEVYIVRFFQNLIGSIMCWVTLANGGGLFCILMIPLFSLIVFIFWIIFKKIILLKIIFNYKNIKKYNWSMNIKSFQSKIAISWVSLYSMVQLIVPIVFYFMGPVISGQIGLSLAIANMIGILSNSWITRNVPLLSKSVFLKNWKLFDNTFRNDLYHSIIFFILIGLLTVIGYKIIFSIFFTDRVLSTENFIYLLVYFFFYYLNNSFAIHLRSYKKEPLVWLFLFGAITNTLFISLFAFIESLELILYSICIIQIFIITPAAFYLWNKNNLSLRKG